VSPRNVEVLGDLMPDPETDLAGLVRDDGQFAAIAEGLGDLLHPDLVSVPAWRGGRTAYSGIDGFREMWLDWLEPWDTYHVKVEEMIDLGDRVVVLIRDRGRRHDMDAEVELIAGSVWTFRDGRVARVEFYGNREEVRAAAGLQG
jgi:ketosteroid isomerase-like protein